MKRVLVTGADGFIGSHLSELLVKKGFSGEIILTPKTAELASIMFETQILPNYNFGIERFIKSKKSDKYHTHMCWGAKKIKEYNQS